MNRICLALLLLGLSPLLHAISAGYEFDDPALRERYQRLGAELRCPKCQNQNIADSNAPIAADLRAQIYRQLQAGRSDREIVDYMVQRYGEFVRYRPRLDSVTALLWLAPLILLCLAALVVAASLRRRPSGAGAASAGVTAAERAQLRSLLDGEDDAGD